MRSLELVHGRGGMAETLSRQLHAISRSASVLRYHTENTVKPQSVGEHTYRVMWLCLILTDFSPSSRLLRGALSHDLPEHVTGDIPAPTKLLLERDTIEAMERQVMAESGLEDVTLTLEDEIILKLADRLDGVLYCHEEYLRGNRHIKNCFANYLRATFELLEAHANDFRHVSWHVKSLNIVKHIKEKSLELFV